MGSSWPGQECAPSFPECLRKPNTLSVKIKLLGYCGEKDCLLVWSPFLYLCLWWQDRVCIHYYSYSILFSRSSCSSSSPQSEKGWGCRLTQEQTALTASFLRVNTPQTIYTHSHTPPPLLRVNIPLPLTCRSGSRTHIHTHTLHLSLYSVFKSTFMRVNECSEPFGQQPISLCLCVCLLFFFSHFWNASYQFTTWCCDGKGWSCYNILIEWLPNSCSMI